MTMTMAQIQNCRLTNTDKKQIAEHLGKDVLMAATDFTP